MGVERLFYFSRTGNWLNNVAKVDCHFPFIYYYFFGTFLSLKTTVSCALGSESFFPQLNAPAFKICQSETAVGLSKAYICLFGLVLSEYLFRNKTPPTFLDANQID